MTDQIQKIILYGCILLAVLALLDRVISRKVIVEEIQGVQVTKEQHNNAARNYHFSYEVLTDKRSFYISQDFNNSIIEGDSIQIKLSLLFNDVNSFAKNKDGNFQSSIVRNLIGIVVPLFMILAGILGIQYKNKVSNFVFVIEVVTIANFLLLLT